MPRWTGLALHNTGNERAAPAFRVWADSMTFDELFAEHDLTPEERAALVAYLASLRMLATLRALMTPNATAMRHAAGENR